MCLLIAAMAGGNSASAAITFGFGGIEPVDNVLMTTSQQGTQIIGDLSGVDVLFTQPTSPETLKTASSGAATIESFDGNGFTSIRTQLLDGSVFGRFTIRPDFDSMGIPFFVSANGGTPVQFTSVSGNNRFYAEATGTTLIQYIDIIAQANSIDSLRQIRIGGVQTVATPEPSSWILLACVLSCGAIIHAVRRRERTRSLAMVG